MKIGFFDSGLGGLIILKSVIAKLPKYDYIYYGDTANMPYGQKTQRQIYRLTERAVELLFSEGCELVIIACNTASSSALPKLQRGWLSKRYPQRRVLGVIVPTVEEAKGFSRVGVLATPATIKSDAYGKELRKINPKIIQIARQSTRLAHYIDTGEKQAAERELVKCLEDLKEKKVTEVLLACTHYAKLKNYARKKYGKTIKIISQDEIVPKKLALYLKRHPEIEARLTKNGTREFYISKWTDTFQAEADAFFGKTVNFDKR